jgi:uncharacterized protein (TIGR02001 family)
MMLTPLQPACRRPLARPLSRQIPAQVSDSPPDPDMPESPPALPVPVTPDPTIRRMSTWRSRPDRTRPTSRHALAAASFGAGLLAVAPAAQAQFQARAPADGRAQVSVAGDLTGYLSAVSDYRFRGVSRTFKDPAVQGGVELKLPSNFYFGTFASMVDKETFANSRGFEWDLYGGYKWRLNDEVSMDAGLIQYLFPTASEFSTLEAFVGATWRWLSFKYYHTLSNRYFGTRNAKHTQYFNLSAVYPLASDLRLQASYGIQKINNNEGDYSDYMVGIAKDWKGFTWGAAIQGTDINASFTNRAGKTRKLGDDGLVLSVSKSF